MSAPIVTPARTGGYFELSTDPVAAEHRREFWRDTVLNRSDADFRADAAARGFSASVRGYIGDGAELRDGTLEAGVLRRGAARCRRDGGDEILLTAIVSTDERAWYQDATGEYRVPAGRFLVTDMSVPFALEMGRYRSINFRLSRAAVAQSIRAWPACLRARMLPATALTTLLFGQLVRFADALPAMDNAEREIALDASADFALATLRLEAMSGALDEGAHWSGLWLAAERFIERNLDRAELGPDTLARVLRCSRTHLYRLFTRHDTTVMDHIRETRLTRCHDMLADPACRLPVAEIAMLHGMDNPSAFSRGFRRRYGCTPGEIRRQARQRRQ
jgi:AraC family transcriptional regulator, positive regulator of tynA and feaB